MLSLEKKSMLSLQKSVEITLEKVNLTGTKAQVVLALDVSGSMGGLYRNGQVQNVADRVLALASKFDDDQAVDIYVFDSGSKRIGSMAIDQFDGYVDRNIYQKGYVGGGTNYAPVINAITKQYGSSGGFMGFGAKKPTLPTYVLFVTDGENSDRELAERAIREASNHAIFWQFVGIGNTRFQFLEELDNLTGRKIDNANFFQLNDRPTDEELYSRMLAEFPSWLSQAKSIGLY